MKIAKYPTPKSNVRKPHIQQRVIPHVRPSFNPKQKKDDSNSFEQSSHWEHSQIDRILTEKQAALLSTADHSEFIDKYFSTKLLVPESVIPILGKTAIDLMLSFEVDQKSGKIYTKVSAH